MSEDLKLKYKYIFFEKTEDLYRGHPVWLCKNKRTKDTLAQIFYHSRWKEFVFSQWTQHVIFNDGCLTDTVHFIQQLNKQLEEGKNG